MDQASSDNIYRDIVGQNHLYPQTVSAGITKPFLVSGPPFDGTDALRFGNDTSGAVTQNAISWASAPIPATGWKGTVSFWLYLNQANSAAVDGDPRILPIGTTTELVIITQVSGADGVSGVLAFQYGTVGRFNNGAVLKVNAWNHCAFTYDGSGVDAGVFMYVNGVDVTAGTAIGDPSNAGFYSFMGRTAAFPGTGSDRQPIGRAADLRFYTGTVLTQAEVVELYQSAFTTELFGVEDGWPPLPYVAPTGNVAFGRLRLDGSRLAPHNSPIKYPRGITAWWPLDSANCDFSASGQIAAKDIVGNNNSTDAKSPGLTSARPGGKPGSVYYNSDGANNNWCVIGDPFGGTTGTNVNVTVAFWTNLKSYLCDTSGNGARAFAFGSELICVLDDVTAGGVDGRIYVQNSTLSTGILTNTILLPKFQWTHVAITVAAGVPTALYLNGAPVPFTTNFSGFGAAAGYAIGGRSDKLRAIDGQLADFMVFKGTILTPDEVNALYNSAVTTRDFEGEWAAGPATAAAAAAVTTAFGRLSRPYNRLSPRKHRPVGRLRIDWTHPVTNGLRYVRILSDPTQSPLLNTLLSGGPDGSLALFDTPISGIGPEGLGLTGAGGFDYLSDGTNFPQTKGTILFRVTAGFSPSSPVHPLVFFGGFRITYDAGPNGWYAGWFLSSDIFVGSGSAGFSAGDSFNVALTYSTSTASKLYVKGQNIGTNATPASPSVTSGSDLRVGSFSSGGASWGSAAGSAMYYVAIWDRELSADEIILLEYDPYCFLESDLESEWAAGPASAGAVVTPTGRVKVWNGSAWVVKPTKVWSGSAWVTKPTKVWNGSAWV